MKKTGNQTASSCHSNAIKAAKLRIESREMWPTALTFGFRALM